MNADFVRYIDSIHREKGIEPEVLFRAFEEALVTAIKKKYEIDDDFEIYFDRQTGEMQSNYEISFEDMGRIFAQTVKQTWFTKIKEAERDVLYSEYTEQIGEILTGSIQRFEGDSVIVQLGNIEGILPRSEKVRSESYHVSERIRAIIIDVRKVGLRVKVILSRTAPDLVRRLFELEVPEIADGIIDIMKLEREPGYRTKVAVTSSDARVDCVGACVGVRGTRIKSIIDEIGGERIDIIRYNEDPEQMLVNALLPAEVSHVQLDDGNKKALVLVEEDQLSLAIGRKGQNVRLASKLCGWDIDIMTRAELEETLKAEDSGSAEAGSEEAGSAEASSEEAGSAEAGSAEAGGTTAEEAGAESTAEAESSTDAAGSETSESAETSETTGTSETAENTEAAETQEAPTGTEASTEAEANTEVTASQNDDVIVNADKEEAPGADGPSTTDEAEEIKEQG